MKTSFFYAAYRICLFIAFASILFSVINFLNWEKEINNILISIAALTLGFLFAIFSFWFYNSYQIAEIEEDEKEWKKDRKRKQ